MRHFWAVFACLHFHLLVWTKQIHENVKKKQITVDQFILICFPLSLPVLIKETTNEILAGWKLLNLCLQLLGLLLWGHASFFKMHTSTSFFNNCNGDVIFEETQSKVWLLKLFGGWHFLCWTYRTKNSRRLNPKAFKMRTELAPFEAFSCISLAFFQWLLRVGLVTGSLVTCYSDLTLVAWIPNCLNLGCWRVESLQNWKGVSCNKKSVHLATFIF